MTPEQMIFPRNYNMSESDPDKVTDFRLFDYFVFAGYHMLSSSLQLIA